MGIKIGYKCEKCEYETEEDITKCPKCSEEENKSSFSKLRGILDNTIELVSLKGKEIIDNNPTIIEHTKKVSEGVSSKYEESGAKKHIDAIKTKSGEKLDVVSGQAMYELVQERLALQERYNDLLATKLNEALERISELEKKLSKLTSFGDES
ncbi:MAG: hypothetical protein IH948_05540 [Bacteroidetes bacterium]|nr:hypothetical protein [Bacteroidota bacterium]